MVVNAEATPNASVIPNLDRLCSCWQDLELRIPPKEQSQEGGCVSDKPYTGECMRASKRRSSCLHAAIAVSSGNSAAAGARTSRKYGHGSSLGLLGSLWDDSWVHPEGYLERNRRAKRSLINELLLSYTPTIGVTFILKHFCARRNPFLRFSVSTVPELYQNPCKRGLFAPRQHSFRWHGGSAA